MNASKRLVLPILTVLLGAVVLLAAGCGTSGPKQGKPKAWNIKLTKQTKASIQVDLLAISSTEDAFWRRSVKPSDCWGMQSPFNQRKDDVVATRFQSGDLKVQSDGTFSLLKTDDIWKRWLARGASELVIMANLPGAYSNDEFDPRRQILPIGKNAWPKDTIEIEILDSQIHVLTPPQQ